MRPVVKLLVPAALASALLMSCKNPPEASPTAVNTAPLPSGHPVVPATPPSEPAATTTSVRGKVIETKDVANYTYVQLETSSGKVWAAVPKATIAVGQEVTVDQAIAMRNFRSQSLDKTFDEIYFGVLQGSDAPRAASASAAPAPLPVPEVIKVAKAAGPNARTVAEVWGQAAGLTGKPVTIQAVVVKVNTGILERNWVHVRDGSGSDASKDNDLLVTTSETPRVGDTVLVSGKVATDKDFGSGYAYKVLVEDGKFTSK